MKKTLLTLLIVLMAALAAHADVVINATNFPDANFRSFLLNEYPSGTITTAQLNARDSLYLYNKGISNLKGVEHFTQLTYLMCYSNNLTSVDVSHNTKLIYLNLGDNKLTSINVSSNTALQDLYLQRNSFSSSINVSYHSALKTFWVNNNPNLKGLYCWRNNLTNFVVSGCTSLTELKCYNNANLSTIGGLADCTELTYLDCEDCSISDLSAVSGLSKLETLLARNNRLSGTLDVSYHSHLNKLRVSGNTQLTQLDCYNCDLNSLDVSGCTGLTKLKCYFNDNLEAITGLANCTALTYLDCEDCAITYLPGVENMSNLQTLWCRNNQLAYLAVDYLSKLKYLRVSGNTNMTELHCGHCNLTSFDVTNCTALTDLYCSDNASLTSITGLSTCTALTYLSFEYCAMPSLDATFCPGLQQLYCYHNNLSELNVTGLTQLGLLNCKENEQLTEITGLVDCTKMYYLECSDCSLTTLDLRYKDDLQELWCRNNQLTILSVNGKPNLTTLVVGGNELLANLQCYDCALTTFDVTGCTALSYLDCDNNQLTELDVTTCPALRYLNCNGNQLTELDISNNSEIEALWCNDNQLSSLDMSRCSSLFFSLDCRYNNISGTIDLSRYSELYQVACNNNQISQLILGEHDELIDLWCSNNQLTSLDISGCSALERLYASYNQLTSLDASGLSNLIDMYVQYNQLTSLKVDNCINLVLLINFGNCIKASQMGRLVNGLPTRSDNQHGELYVMVDGDSSGEIVEGNVITVSQVNQAVAKNWDVYKWNWDSEAWENYAGSDGLPGDVNDDGNVTIADVTALIDYLLSGGASTVNDANADVNDDGSVTIADVTALIDYLLSGGASTVNYANADVTAPAAHSASASKPLIPHKELVLDKQNARVARR